jgi:hypothetical protein
MVLFAPAPTGTLRVVLAIDGHTKAVLPPDQQTWIGPAVTKHGRHVLSLTAYAGRVRIVARSRRVLHVVPPSNPVFERNAV